MKDKCREQEKKGKKVDTLPDRTDMNKEEIKKMKKKPLKKIKKETEIELKDYANENGEVDILEAVEKINKEIDEEKYISDIE